MIEEFTIYDKFGKFIKSNKKANMFIDLPLYTNCFRAIFEGNIIDNEIMEIINFYRNNKMNKKIRDNYNEIYNRLIMNNNIIKLM
jgi:hypothetical protein